MAEREDTYRAEVLGYLTSRRPIRFLNPPQNHIVSKDALFLPTNLRFSPPQLGSKNIPPRQLDILPSLSPGRL
jgi:hypothetical protein